MPASPSAAAAHSDASNDATATATAETAQRPPRPGATRLHHLDALRGGALLLGIVLHTVLGFVPDSSWLFQDTRTVAWGEAVVVVIHLFRMVLFMMLAGYFGRMVLRRRGTGSYVKDRMLRIGLPLLAFWPLAVLSLPIVIVIGSQLRGTELPTDPRTEGQTPGLLQVFAPGQLWFLLLLLEIILVTLAVGAILRRLLGAGRAEAISRRIGAALAAPAGLALAAIPYALGLLTQGTNTGGIMEPITILPVPGASIAYAGAFAVGWFLHASPGSLDRVAAAWPVKLGLAVALTVGSLLLTGTEGRMLAVVAVAGTALAGWAWVYALIGITARFLNREIVVVRYLADASYWIYLLHLPLVVALGLTLADLPAPAPLKLIVNLVLTTGILLLTYDLFVRSTWIGGWLNGHRRPRALLRTRVRRGETRRA